jgi:hypothetical protein
MPVTLHTFLILFVFLPSNYLYIFASVLQNAYFHITYLLNPWSKVFLEKPTDFAPSQEIPRIYGTRKFITVLTSARHLSLS